LVDLVDRHTRLLHGLTLNRSRSHLSPGWFDLADKLCFDLEALHASELLRIVQIKEKYGALRVYVRPCLVSVCPQLMEKARALCKAAEQQSEGVCEGCGAPSALHQNALSWWSTLCPICTERKESAG
jgi:hypothetical protein